MTEHRSDTLALRDSEKERLKASLKPISNSPCGVSSQSNAPQSRISAIRPHGEKGADLKRLAEIISGLPGCEISSLQEGHLYAVCTRWFLFTDDLELVWSESEKVFHIRSIARSGITDFGANRTRVNYIQRQFDKGYLF